MTLEVTFKIYQTLDPKTVDPRTLNPKSLDPIRTNYRRRASHGGAYTIYKGIYATRKVIKRLDKLRGT